MHKYSVIGVLLSATLLASSSAVALSIVSGDGIDQNPQHANSAIHIANAKRASSKAQVAVAKKVPNAAKVLQMPILSPVFTLKNVPLPNAAYPAVNSVAISPDGLTVVTGSDDGMVRLWNISTGSVLFTMKNHHLSAVGATKFQSPVRTVAFSPDGKTIATGSYPGVALYDARTGTELRTYNLTSMTAALAFSPDGQMIAAGSAAKQLAAQHGGDIKILDANSGSVLTTIPNITGGVTSVAFSPDGKNLASAGVNGEVILWDVGTAQKLGNFDSFGKVGNQDYARSVAFSPDGQTLVTGGGSNSPWQGIVKFWDIQSGALIKAIKEGEPINSVAFSHDGKRIAAANWDKSVRIYTLQDAFLVGSTKVFMGGWSAATAADGHSASVNSVVFSANDKLIVSAGGDHSVKGWRF